MVLVLLFFPAFLYIFSPNGSSFDLLFREAVTTVLKSIAENIQEPRKIYGEAVNVCKTY